MMKTALAVAAAMSIYAPAYSYEAIKVSEGGTLTGTVTLEGTVRAFSTRWGSVPSRAAPPSAVTP